MYKDNSERTSAVNKPFIRTTIALVMMMIAIIALPFGIIRYNAVVAKSSTMIGSELKFERSDAGVTLQNIYTDKKSNVLIARLKLSDSAQANLPFKGSDYKVMIGAKSLKGLEEVSVLFGKMSSDGDMFLVIPKPNIKEIYTLFIINERYVAAADSSKIGAKTISDTDLNRSIANTLSAYDVDRKKDKNAVTSVKSDNLDAITFKLAMTPGVNNDKYKPTVLDADLLNEETQEFDFEKFFNVLFKDVALKNFKRDYENLVSQKKQVQIAIDEAKSKIQINQYDKAAGQTLSKSQDQMKILEGDMAKLANDISKYESLQYTPSLFSNLNTKAKVFDIDSYTK